MTSRIVPPSPICDLMRSVRPTSLRSMVWNGLFEPEVLVVNEPVMKGTFWPTTIFASSLSSATMLGVARMLASALVSRKRASAPMFHRSPTFCRMPKFRPAGIASVASPVRPWLMAPVRLTMLPAPVKLVPPA